MYEVLKDMQEESIFSLLNSDADLSKAIVYTYTHSIHDGDVVLVMEFKNHRDYAGFGSVELRFHPHRVGEECKRTCIYSVWHTGVGVEGFEKAAKIFMKVKNVMSQIPNNIFVDEFLKKIEEKGIKIGINTKIDVT
jgi:hypothetical protein